VQNKVYVFGGYPIVLVWQNFRKQLDTGILKIDTVIEVASVLQQRERAACSSRSVRRRCTGDPRFNRGGGPRGPTASYGIQSREELEAARRTSTRRPSVSIRVYRTTTVPKALGRPLRRPRGGRSRACPIVSEDPGDRSRRRGFCRQRRNRTGRQEQATGIHWAFCSGIRK
jgi:hypothetical protein